MVNGLSLVLLFTVPTPDRGAIHYKHRMGGWEVSNNPNSFIGIFISLKLD
jgi:hypothetical protein